MLPQHVLSENVGPIIDRAIALSNRYSSLVAEYNELLATVHELQSNTDDHKLAEPFAMLNAKHNEVMTAYTEMMDFRHSDVFGSINFREFADTDLSGHVH